MIWLKVIPLSCAYYIKTSKLSIKYLPESMKACLFYVKAKGSSLSLKVSLESVKASSLYVKANARSFSIKVSPESVKARPFGHVPDSDGFVLRVGEDQVLARVEDGAGHVVVVPAAGVHFPGLPLQKKINILSLI
jgi:hypothetical protein